MALHGKQQSTLRLSARRLRTLYETLFSAYGPQHWWPGETRFEILVGAILTQNTAWKNVERAIANLKSAGALDPEAILQTPARTLAVWLRPSGYFNVKADRLRTFCHWYLAQGGFDTLAAMATDALRQALLSVKGIGPETADDMLLYAFERPVFVVDAYTRRLFSRHGLIEGREAYDSLRLAIESALGPDVPLYNEYHALIVRHAKEACRATPDCRGCPVRRGCRSHAA